MPYFTGTVQLVEPLGTMRRFLTFDPHKKCNSGPSREINVQKSVTNALKKSRTRQESNIYRFIMIRKKQTIFLARFEK